MTIPEYDNPMRTGENKACDAPFCGRCGIAMTPQNSHLQPEYFLCDKCAVILGYACGDAPQPTPEQQFGISAEDVSALKELRDHTEMQTTSSLYAISHDALRWLRAFDKLTQDRFK